MSSSTSTLELFKYDTSTDGKEVFSINTALNANWDKIDSFASAIKSLSNLDAQGEKRFTDIQNSLANKLEADVLLEENGYIKFNNMKVQYGYKTKTNTETTLTFPRSYSKTPTIITTHVYSSSGGDLIIKSYSKTSFTARCTAYDGFFWMSIGY